MNVGVLGHRLVATTASQCRLFLCRYAPAGLALMIAGLLLIAGAACVVRLGWMTESKAQQHRTVMLNSVSRQAAIRLDHDVERRVSQLTELVTGGLQRTH